MVIGGACLLVACGDGRLSPDLGAGGDLGSAASLRVDTVTPAVAALGDLVILDGVGLAGATVRWGDAVISPVWQGAARLAVRVPTDALVGALSIAGSDGVRVEVPLDLLRTGVAPQPVPRWPAQTMTATLPTRLPAGDEAAIVRVGSRVFALGGRDERGRPVDAVRAAELAVDGTLGPFQALPVRLSAPRAGHSAHVVGGAIVVVGGSSIEAPLASIERLPIAPDGALGPPAPAGSLRVARARFAAAVAGGALVVAGGSNGFPLASVERIPIAADGTLGSSELVGAGLVRPRAGASLAVGEEALWVLGGVDGDQLVSEVERLAIADDGRLSPPSSSAVRLSTPRAFASLTAVGGFLVWAGGVVRDGATLAPSATASLLSVDAVGPAERATVSAGAARAAHGAVAAGTGLLLVGGRDAVDAVGAHGVEVARASLISGGGVLVAAGAPDDAGPRRFAVRWLLGDRQLSCGGLGATTVVADCVARELAAGTRTASSALSAPRTGAIAVDAGQSLLALFGVREPTSNAIDRTADRALPPHFSSETVETMLADPPANACAVVIGDELVVAGGKVLRVAAQNGIRDEVLAARLDADGRPGAFRTVGRLAVPRYAHSCAVVGESLVVVGGTTCSDSATPCAEAALASTEILRAADWGVAAGPALDSPRSGAALAVVGGQLFVLGGNGATAAVRSAIASNGSLGPFTAVDSPLPATWAGGAAVVAGERIFLVDGDAEAPVPTALALVPAGGR